MYTIVNLNILEFHHLVQVYCALVRSTIEYSSAIYSSLPSYLADLIKCIQKRALRIICPQHSYNKALEEAELSTLYDRRSEACKRFIKSINISNPFFNIVKNEIIYPNRSSSRAGITSLKRRIVSTERLANFVTHKYAIDLVT